MGDIQEVRYEGIHCTLAIQRPSSDIVVVKLSGRDAGEFGDVSFQELAKDLARNRQIELFIDARDVRGASIDVSNDWARWMRTNRAGFKQINMLTGSRFVQLTADFVLRFAELGNIMRIYTEATAFDDALAHAVAEKRSAG